MSMSADNPLRDMMAFQRMNPRPVPTDEQVREYKLEVQARAAACHVEETPGCTGDCFYFQDLIRAIEKAARYPE